MEEITETLSTTVITESKEECFQKIVELFNQRLTLEVYEQITTTKGNTQETERIYIDTMKSVLETLNYSYEEAGSQQKFDFRKVNGIPDFNLELKKTKGYSIMCNDTLPSNKAFYIVIFTGNSHYPPQLIAMNGGSLIDDESSWVYDYHRHILFMRELYRGRPGNVSVCARANFSVNIRDHLSES